VNCDELKNDFVEKFLFPQYSTSRSDLGFERICEYFMDRLVIDQMWSNDNMRAPHEMDVLSNLSLLINDMGLKF
jgi:hypothetical protein